ncbi:MAG: AMP-binding protein [Actinobacteria bacterium]|nr:AMP-binding protein [Actinomycetota bacterium]
MGVGSWIERRARAAPAGVALITGDRSVTYAELAGRVRRLANGLRTLGVAKGDRVAWLGPNHPAFLESLFAAGLLGAALAPVNHRLDAAEINWIFEDTKPRVLIQHVATGATAVRSPGSRQVTVGGSLDGAADFEALIAASPGHAIEERVGLDDLCLLPHTSGTTGRPKGVMLTHGNLTWNVANLLSCADFRGDDVTIALAPFFRVGGTGVNVLPVLFMGGTVVVPDDVHPDGILRLTEQHHVTVGFGNPDILASLTRSPLWPAADLSSVRFLITGGAPVPEPLIRTYLERGLALLQGYGLSEAAPVALVLQPQAALSKVGSAGTPPLFVDTKIAGPDGAEAAPGQVGELSVRGPNVMAGYWNRPKDTAAVLTPDGWLRTGDAARPDQDGYIWIVGRTADSFISCGQVVHPGDVERILLSHPAVADAGVAPVPASGKQQTATAVVVVAPGAQTTERELLAWCREHLAAHQVPAVVIFTDHLPRNSVGKLIRPGLQKAAVELMLTQRRQPLLPGQNSHGQQRVSPHPPHDTDHPDRRGATACLLDSIASA